MCSLTVSPRSSEKLRVRPWCEQLWHESADFSPSSARKLRGLTAQHIFVALKCKNRKSLFSESIPRASRWPLTPEGRVRYQANTCWICGGRNESEREFFQYVTLYTPTNLTHDVWGGWLYNS